MNTSARMALIAFSALAYPLAFPPFAQPWLLAIVWPALLAALIRLDPPWARAAGFVWGLIVFGTGLSWFWNIFGVPCLALFAILAIFPALFAGACAKAQKRGWSGGRLACFIAVVWGSTEFIRGEVFCLKFPWLSIGSAVAPNFLHPMVGTYGIGFIVALGGAMVVHGRHQTRLCGVAMIAFVFVSPFIATTNVAEAPGFLLAGIQAEEGSPDHYLKLSESASEEARIIIWPEYALPFDLRKNTFLFAKLMDFAKARKVVMVVGTQTHTSNGIWRNTALTFDGSGALGEHHKQHTVHFFNDGTQGTMAAAVNTPFGKIGTPVCFDCDFQDVVRRMTTDGAIFFLVPMMDAQLWTLKQHLQHAQLFRLRAAENGRWIAVVGTSGVSQIIDSSGRVRASIEPMTSGVLNGAIVPTHNSLFSLATAGCSHGSLSRPPPVCC